MTLTKRYGGKKLDSNNTRMLQAGIEQVLEATPHKSAAIQLSTTHHENCVLASSDGISSWTPLKPQHSNPNPNPFGQSTLVYWLPYSSHTSHHPSQTPCLPWISYATQKLILDSDKVLQRQSGAFHAFLWDHFFQV